MSESGECTFWCSVKHHFLQGCNEDEPCLWYYFGAAYAALAVATLVQLLRILNNMSEYGWTMQKTFHVLNLVVCTSRAVLLCLWNIINNAKAANILEVILFSLPTLLFFSTYTLLVLFWAEIVHAARPKTLIQPKAAYSSVNLVAYMLSVVFWGLCGNNSTQAIGKILDSSWHIALNLLAAAVFVAYGYMLLKMLRRSPVVSAVRKKKFVEIAVVTVLSVLCFCGKAVLQIIAVVEKRGLDYNKGLLIDGLFYGITEVLVIATSLGVLSGMPNKQAPTGDYQPLAEST